MPAPVTTNLIDAQGVFGWQHLPGINMRLKAMHHFTGKLPLVEPVYHDELLGYNTTTALQNGAVRGAIYEIVSFCKRAGKFPGCPHCFNRR